MVKIRFDYRKSSNLFFQSNLREHGFSCFEHFRFSPLFIKKLPFTFSDIAISEKAKGAHI